MRRSLFVPFAAFLMLAPQVFAGSSEAPEVEDGADAVPAALDVLAAWWEVESATTVLIHVKVRDLTLFGQPLADADDRPEDVRYYYNANFSVAGRAIGVRCTVGLVESSPVKGATPTGEFGGTVGTHCNATKIPPFFSSEAFAVTTRTDRLADTFTFVLTESAHPPPLLPYVESCLEGRCEENPPHVDVRPGQEFRGLAIRTATGSVATLGTSNHQDTVRDVAGPGLTFTA